MHEHSQNAGLMKRHDARGLTGFRTAGVSVEFLSVCADLNLCCQTMPTREPMVWCSDKGCVRCSKYTRLYLVCICSTICSTFFYLKSLLTSYLPRPVTVHGCTAQSNSISTQTVKECLLFSKNLFWSSYICGPLSIEHLFCSIVSALPCSCNASSYISRVLGLRTRTTNNRLTSSITHHRGKQEYTNTYTEKHVQHWSLGLQ